MPGLRGHGACGIVEMVPSSLDRLARLSEALRKLEFAGEKAQALYWKRFVANAPAVPTKLS